MDFIPFLSNCLSRKSKDQNTENDRDMQFNQNNFKGKALFKAFNEEEVSSAGSQHSNSSKLNLSKKLRSLNASRIGSGEDKSKLYAVKVDSTDDSVNEEGIEFMDNLKHKVFTAVEWQKILKNGDLDSTSVTELVYSLRYGIPDELRPPIWEFLTKLDTLRSQYPPDYYANLKNQASSADNQIKKDVCRTFPLHPFFKNPKNNAEGLLFNILRAYSNHDQEIKYTQGMNFIVGQLLIILDPELYRNSSLEYFKTYEQDYEEKVFWFFIHITYEKNWRQVFRKDFPKMKSLISALDARLKLRAPEVYNQMANSEFDTFNCFHAMFICLLLDSAPVELSKRLLDLFFIEQEKIIFRVLIRVVMLSKKEILEASKNDYMQPYIKQKMMEACYQKYKDNLHFLFPCMEATD